MPEGGSRDGLGLELVSGSPWENWTRGQHGLMGSWSLSSSLLKAQNTVCSVEGREGGSVAGTRRKQLGNWEMAE